MALPLPVTEQPLEAPFEAPVLAEAVLLFDLAGVDPLPALEDVITVDFYLSGQVTNEYATYVAFEGGTEVGGCVVPAPVAPDCDGPTQFFPIPTGGGDKQESFYPSPTTLASAATSTFAWIDVGSYYWWEAPYPILDEVPVQPVPPEPEEVFTPATPPRVAFDFFRGRTWGVGCDPLELAVGGPAWVRVEGLAPSWRIQPVYIPGTGEILVSGQAPSLVFSTILRPGVAEIVVAGQAPTIFQNLILTPAPAEILVAGQAPALLGLLGDVPCNAVYFDGEPVLYGGEYVTFGTLTADTTGVSADSTCGTADFVEPILLSPGTAEVLVSGPAPSVVVQPVPESVSGLQLWLDASDASTITDAGAGAVSAWADKSPNGYSFTQGTSALRPTTGSTSLNGLNTLSFAGDYLTSTASLGTFNWMHNGTSFTVFAVCSFGTVVDPNAAYGLFGTNGATTGATGFSIWWDDRAGISRNEAIQALMTYSSAGNAVIGSGTASAFWPPQGRYILTYQADPDNGTASARDSVQRNSGTASQTNAATNSPTTSNHTRALQIGALGNNVLPLTGQIAEFVVYNRALSAAEIDVVEAYLASKWGITLA